MQKNFTSYLYAAAQMNLIEDGFYDPGQLRPGSKFRTLEDYLQEPLNDKRPVFYINGKPEWVHLSYIRVLFLALII